MQRSRALSEQEAASLGRRLRDAQGQAELFRGALGRRDAELEAVRQQLAGAVEALRAAAERAGAERDGADGYHILSDAVWALIDAHDAGGQ